MIKQLSEYLTLVKKRPKVQVSGALLIANPKDQRLPLLT